MGTVKQMLDTLNSGKLDDRLCSLYGKRADTLAYQKERYALVARKHEEEFGSKDHVLWVSAPGRIEIGGNHTDHNRGKVLAAAVNLDTLAAVSPRNDLLVHLHAEGYQPIVVNLTSLQPRKEEQGTTAALIRGVAYKMRELGYPIGGFDAFEHSTVRSGSGLSSSASFEVMLVAIFDALYNDFSIDYKTRAIISQYAENHHFGKPSGLLDQMTSSAGGLITVDFINDDPAVEALSYDFSAHHSSVVVVETGGSHADLTDFYAAIPAEMSGIAEFFGEKYLRCVKPSAFYNALPKLMGKISDRAILRAMHFYAENDRVSKQVAALKTDDLSSFYREVIASGRSSFMYLQNVFASPEQQGVSIALALAEELLQGKGAWRVHGGGFAGTTLDFMPQEKLQAFIGVMEQVFGEGSCRVLSIRPEGASVIDIDA